MVAESRQALIQIGHADGGRAHVHAAATLAQVEGRADDGDVGMMHDVVSGLDAMDEFIATGSGGAAKTRLQPALCNLMQIERLCWGGILR